MAAMTYEERARAARTPSSSFPLSVTSALTTHAIYVLGDENSADDQKSLARSVINSPESYSYRFGLAVLTRPIYAEIERIEDIPDSLDQPGSNGLLQNIATVFPLFVAPAVS